MTEQAESYKGPERRRHGRRREDAGHAQAAEFGTWHARKAAVYLDEYAADHDASKAVAAEAHATLAGYWQTEAREHERHHR